MVELCPSRVHILKLDEKTLLEEAKSINIPKVLDMITAISMLSELNCFSSEQIRGILQSHGYINGIFFILLLQMSAQIAKDLGMAPGGEFRRAFEEIHKLPGCILHLGDRPIRITLYRALRALSVWQTMKLVWRLTFTDSISIEEVEECKQSDLLEKLMQEMAGEFPAFSDVFVRERDLFCATRCSWLPCLKRRPVLSRSGQCALLELWVSDTPMVLQKCGEPSTQKRFRAFSKSPQPAWASASANTPWNMA